MSSTSSTSTGARRPCLKRFTTQALPPSSQPSSAFQRSRSVQLEMSPLCTKSAPNSSRVHFPPTPTLSTTFPTHSKRTYDRRPLVVQPNVCAIPERGCPGRTYVLERTQSDPELSMKSKGGPVPPPLSGPRVREPGDDLLDIIIDEEDTDGPDRQYLHMSRSSSSPSHSSSYLAPSTVTPSKSISRASAPALPALIPDHGISSSESEESDALTSPNTTRFLPVSTFMSKPSLSPVEDERLVFLPHPPSPELRTRDREREKREKERRRRRREIEEEMGKWKTSMHVRDDTTSSCLGGF